MMYLYGFGLVLSRFFFQLQVRLMERRLNEVDYSVSPTANNSELYPTHQELSVTEKDRIIRSLESEVEAQVISSEQLLHFA